MKISKIDPRIKLLVLGGKVTKSDMLVSVNAYRELDIFNYLMSATLKRPMLRIYENL